MKFKDLSGMKFGRWIVLRLDPDKNARTSYFICQCECGTIRSVRGADMTIGKNKSCGCLKREIIRQAGLANKTHGMTHSKTFGVWSNMLQRCTNPNHQSWKDYGGRGISVCERWKVFSNFFQDMGESPEGLTLERKDSNGNYEPGNCRWATIQEQNRNKRNTHHITFLGKTQTIGEWASQLGINQQTLEWRFYQGWPTERALTKGVKSEGWAPKAA